MKKYLVTWSPFSDYVNVRLVEVRETAKCYMVDDWTHGKQRYKKCPGDFDYERWFDEPQEALELAKEKYNKVVSRLEKRISDVLDHAQNNWGLKSAEVVKFLNVSEDQNNG